MEGGSKKRPKMMFVGFDSTDDEPIGNLFKLKGKKNLKKMKGEVGSSNEKEKEKVGKEEDLGGLDDTLASLRKKLKGPKKVSLGLDLTDLSGQTVGELVSDVEMRIVTEKVVKVDPKDGLNVGIDNEVENKENSGRELIMNEKSEKVVEQDGSKAVLDGDTDKIERSKRSKRVKKVKKISDDLGYRITTQSDKVCDLVVLEGSDLDSSKKLEDPLSVLLQESKLGSKKKSANNSKSKPKRNSPKPKDGNSSCRTVTDLQVEGVEKSLSFQLVSPEPANIDINLTNSTIDHEKIGLNTILNDPGPANIDINLTNSNIDHEKIGLNTILNDPGPANIDINLTNSTIGHEKIGLNTILNDHIEDISTTVSADVKVESSGGMKENPLLISSLESGFNECSNKSLESKEGIMKKEVAENVGQLDSDGMGCLQNGDSDELLSDNLKNNCSLQSRVLTPIKEESCGDHDRLAPPSREMLQSSPVQNDDDLSVEANGASSLSVSPDRNNNCEEAKKSLLVHKSDDMKLSEVVKRKSKKRRHNDMAYEGDLDWHVLIQEQGFAQCPLIEEDDLSFNENVGAAAVSAGLKARAVSPLEKIKFKEVLKRKGGLQGYLKCRNQILALWSKDVTRILPLTECGVTAIPLANESPRDSLTRDIYEFLNQSGYINVGIASEKDATELWTGHNLKLVDEKTFGIKADAPDADADADDGVSFILGQVRNPEAPVTEKSNNMLDNNCRVGEDAKENDLDIPQVMGSMPTNLGSDQCQTDELLKDTPSVPKEMPNLDNILNSFKVFDTEEAPVLPTNPAQFTSSYTRGGADSEMECVSDGKKRIIVIGAGPAGLTAARHLQRHGFSVDVLEARERVGGRVYTDRSSLSVPVDLGASIITGVEADVATERRADPSSLVCAQLGLELTVLKSDCPLYDVVTGQKVPADLDDALEAEYNALLDDVPLLVSQKGERGAKMSLEDGLEHALRNRRKAQLGRSYKETEFGNFVKDDILSPLERRVMNWHFAHLEYGCAALLQDVSLPHWNQDDAYGGFGGAHCMIKGGYSAVVESLGRGLNIHLNHIVTNVSYSTNACGGDDVKGNNVTVYTANGGVFSGDAVLITVPLGCLKARDIDFSPPLPHWKELSIQRLGFGVLNKVVMEFPNVFWDDSVDYFGATAEETDLRGKCFMFWNVKKTVGAPVLIALVVGKAAIEGQKVESSDLVDHALAMLVKLFGKDAVPEPIASVVTDWGNDPFSYGAYSYVAIGASGEDYDILGKPVENCLFFAGEATCKEYPDTVGGAMLSGLRESVRIIDLVMTGNDYSAEVEALEAAQRHLDSERNEVRDITKRLEGIQLSNALYKNTYDGARAFTRKSLLRDMFGYAKTTAGRLVLAKELLSLPVEALKSFAGTKAGLSILNSWILDSMGKDGTQLLRHCVRILVLVSTDLLAVRLSGVGKTIKEKVCVHTSRDIRAIASQLVNVWVEVFRKEKASNGGSKLLRHSVPRDSLKSKPLASGKVHPRAHVSSSSRSHLPPLGDNKRIARPVSGEDPKSEEDHNSVMSEEEKVAYAAAEAARAAALAAAEAYASSEAKCKTSLPLPKIPSFHKFARREQYTQMEEFDERKNWSGATLGRQECTLEIDSRNCRVRDWSVSFPAACVDLENVNNSVDNLSQRSHSNDIAAQLNMREQSGESAAIDNSIYTKAWVEGCGSDGLKDYNAIDRWQSQAAAAESEFYYNNIGLRDEQDSVKLKPPLISRERVLNESSVSQVTVNKELVVDQPRGPEKIKLSVVNFVGSLLMPLYREKKIDKDGYKSIMKKAATKVMEQSTDAEKGMTVNQFLDMKRKNKIRDFVDKLIAKHIGTKVKP